ncbi:hypothetical protein E2562_008982 [Oryza meyeriana var. granulata]|uniref:Obtusifoliol 14-alpha demethylase n=1 Tax=Oryza meyeriana var. granulata TaxID=110450 RepID=A0A6G1D0S2_9ORYZ|nr:hypothetical protein E2562_008982 [Oryza meyeriana var. granulata]
MDRFNSSQAGSMLLQALPVRVGMDMATAAVWSAIAVLLTTVVVAAKTMMAKRSAAAAAKLPLPPVVSGVSLIIPVISRGPRAVVEELYGKLGSVFTVGFLGMKTTFLIGSESLDSFFTRPDAEVHQAKTYRNLTVPIFGKGVMYDVDVATRAEQFAASFEALRPTKLRSNAVAMVREAEEFFAKWGDQGTVDLKHELHLVILTTASRIILGKEVRETMLDDFASSFHELMNNGTHIVSLFFPNLPIPRHRRRDAASARVRGILARAIKLRRASGRVEDDMLQRYLETKYRDGRPMSDDEIIGLLTAMVVAGHKTMATNVTWTGAFLLANPNHLAAAVDEQRCLIARHGADRVVDYAALTEMDTLHCCIKEALRVYPPVPLLLRSVRKGFTVRTREGKEYEVPEGHTLVCYTALNNRLGHVYRDPGEYDPERFGPERNEDKVAGKFSFTSFGAGRHTCLGAAYAFLQMKAVWSHLLRNFELELISPFPELEVNNPTPGPRGKVMVSYKRRKLSS